jgi:transposase InsO family protein
MVFDENTNDKKGGNQMTPQQLIAQSRKKLLIFAERHSITQACRVFGVSRTTFYKVKKQYIATGSLEPRVRRTPRMPNATALSVKKALLKIVQDNPARGSAFYSYELRQDGIHITQQGVWYCLQRFGLNNRYKRLLYIETLNDRNQPLTEVNVRKLKREYSHMLHGQWPGHVVALDTFYVGNLRGVGRIYQITGIDLSSRFGWAKLYTTKAASSTIDFMEQCLIPMFFNNTVDIESVLTDNGTEFINSDFRQVLIDYDIRHHRIPKGQPFLNGYCERFQRTILEEFYAPSFRRTFFDSLDSLQEALNRFLTYYNFERVHFGLIKTGAIPADVLKSRVTILRQRFQKLLT